MKLFAELFTRLDQTNKTNLKVEALVDYFSKAPSADAAWVVYLLSGRKLKRIIQSKLLKLWAMELTDTPEWLFAECRSAVGETAETISLLLLDSSDSSAEPSLLHTLIEDEILPLKTLSEKEQQQAVEKKWNSLGLTERFLYTKILTGQFRVGVSKGLIIRALSKFTGFDTDIITLRLMGEWAPTKNFFDTLVSSELKALDTPSGRPYPFFLANPIIRDPSELGEIKNWVFEWKWDGIRSQLIKRNGEVYLWSRGGELISDQFPEILSNAKQLQDGIVLDGELLVETDNGLQSFAKLQTRIGRKNVSNKMLNEMPVTLRCFDLLEYEGKDIRSNALHERKSLLHTVLNENSQSFRVSETLQIQSWEDASVLRNESRSRLVEGFMIKEANSEYGVGRKRGAWWKWKVDPYTIDAVMIYAQKGTGRRADLFTDYTFAVWSGDTLLPFAKAYSGLSDDEIAKVNRWVKKHTKEKFGPVRSVTPELVFEIAFEGIQKSSRHKSGVAVRFPRILRWRTDKKASEADSIESLEQLINER